MKSESDCIFFEYCSTFQNKYSLLMNNTIQIRNQMTTTSQSITTPMIKEFEETIFLKKKKIHPTNVILIASNQLRQQQQSQQ